MAQNEISSVSLAAKSFFDMPHDLPHLQRLKKHLASRRETLISKWRERVLIDRKVSSANQLSRTEFRDHVPVILQILENRLVEHGDEVPQISNPLTTSECEVALTHGDQRWHQGYSMEEIMREWSHLNLVVCEELEAYCAENLSEENKSAAVKARRIWAEIMGEGITQSAARFDDLQKAEAQINVRELEAIVERTRLFEKERGIILRQATHDIRGSLSVVRGATSLLDWQQIEKLAPEDRQNVFRILSSGVHSLWEMMSEMLDLAKLEAKVETINLAHFDVGRELGELCESALALADEKKLVFTIEGPKSLWAEGDMVKTKRIAQNLLLNALKYTQTGYVKLCWDIKDECWELEIHDSGPGLNHNPAIETAPQADANKHYAQSEGVGLSIVKRLCELCAATLQIETSEAGSCFRVTFPLSYS